MIDLKDKQMWILVIIALIILTPQLQGTSEKKEVGGVILAGSILYPLALLFPVGWIPFILGGLLIAFLGPMALGNVVNIFRPEPSIPIWVWGIGFVILFMMLMGGKKK